MDGLKPSQRKILYGAYLRGLDKDEIKVAQLAGFVSDKAAYHHGEMSLNGAIIGMAQDYVGSNNINILAPLGNFGGRHLGGKDAASPRYIFTKITDISSLIFKKIDNNIVNKQEEDGMPIEPEYYAPIIPMILVNGASGIGTGFSTDIPSFNPIDIINNLLNMIDNKETIKMKPFWRNFNGIVEEINDTTYETKGLYSIKKNKLIITELPIKYWTNDYKEFLEDLIYEKKSELFKSYSNLSSDVEIKFILKIDDIELVNKLNIVDEYGMNSLYKYLHLYKTIKQSNMNLYTSTYKIKTFKTTDEIMLEFYNWRLTFYDKRKTLILNKLNDSMKLISSQIKFINLVIQENGKILNLNDDELNKYLMKNKIIKMNDSYDYLTNMTFKQITKQNFEKLNIKLKEIKSEYKMIESKTNKEMWLNDLHELNNLIY
jgi:DNA topoisomerase-2